MPASRSSRTVSTASLGRQTKETRRLQRLRRRLARVKPSTTVLVTLLVALLTVWVAPSFAHQWDDRQKARELQAALAQDVAASTAAALGDGLAVLAGTDSRDPIALQREWDIARFRLDATLRAYYPPSVVARWYETSENLADLHRVAPECRKILADAKAKRRYDEGFFREWCLQDLFVESAWGPYKPPPDSFIRGFRLAEKYARWIVGARVVEDPLVRLGRMLRMLFIERIDRMQRDILDTAPRGFSTTTSDLIRDLLPG